MFLLTSKQPECSAHTRVQHAGASGMRMESVAVFHVWRYVPMQVKVKKRGDDRKFIARVLSIGVDCDVALLTVDDDEFW